LGVTIGAPVIQYLGWRALFWGELPLMALAAALALVVLPSDRAGARGRPAVDVGTGSGGGGPASPVRTPWQELDWLGSLLLAVSVTGGLLALNQAPSWGFGNPRTVGLFATSAAFGAAFVLQERRCPSPLVPLRYFRLRNFVFPVGARASVNFAYMGGFFLFPILMERVYGYSETTAGLVSTARPLLFSVVAPIAGYAAVRVGERASVVAGAVSLTASMVLFTQLGADPSLAVILVALALSGVGNGLSTPSSTSSASNELDPSELGVMSAAQQLIAQIGIVAGIQVMVTVQASPGGGAGSLSDFHRAFALAAVVAVLSGVFGLFVRDTPRTRHRKAGAVTVEAPPGSLDADLPLSGSGEAELPRPSEGEGSAEGGPSATVVGPAGPPEGGGPVGRARGSWPSPARSGVVRRR
ncbi:MAG TPA: MFS transporter, partial [Acidimicrobiales bacterium]|nr:MFS transporter [Acidimicrobiales bacterium]